MKYIIVFVALSLPIFSNANTPESVFKANSIFPASLRPLVISLLEAGCPARVAPYGLNEILTKASVDATGTTNYRVAFSSRYFFDGVHPTAEEITADIFVNDERLLVNFRLVNPGVCE